MHPPAPPQIVWGTQPYPPVNRGFPNPPDGHLWGSSVRRSMGIFQIVCGGIVFAFGIAVICVPLHDSNDGTDYVGWGLWNGVFSTVTGFLGIYSRKRKGMVIAYMVTSIIAAVIGACCCIYVTVGDSRTSWYYAVDDLANLTIYIMCIIFFIQTVISTVGASFTCNVVCSTGYYPQQMIYYYAPQTQQYIPAPPYTLEPAQQCSAPQNPQVLQSTTQISFGSNENSKV